MHLYFIFYFLTSTFFILTDLNSLFASTAENEAISAYRAFSKNLKDFERKRRQEQESLLKNDKKFIEKKISLDEQKLKSEQITSLKKMIEIYRSDLSEISSNIGMQFNLALALMQLADLLIIDNSNESLQLFQDSLDITEKILNRLTFGSDQIILPRALYLRSILQEQTNKRKESIETLNNIVKLGRTDQVSVYTHLRLGDLSYNSSNFSTATDHYVKADVMANKILTQDPHMLKPKILYRISWAAYKQGMSELSLKSVLKLYREHHWGQGTLDVDATKEDATFLLSEALFTRNSIKFTENFINENIPICSEVIAKFLARLASNDRHEKVTEVGEIFLKKIGLSRDSPAILSLLGQSYRHIGNRDKSDQHLERLALMLPQGSLWRASFSSDLKNTKKMEVLAEAAALNLAVTAYSSGLISENPRAFIKAEEMFKLLVDTRPTDRRVSEWKLKIAHSNFFAKKFESAYVKYKSTILESELSTDQLKIALYQSVVASENAWRTLYDKVSSSTNDANKNIDVIKSCQRVEDSVNHYVERFPQESRSIDLLLIAASVNRDMDNFSAALGFWERVLLLQASTSQRALAIRGILYAKTKTSSSREVIESAFRLLKLENLNFQDKSLYQEINGVLSAALQSEADRLKSQGSFMEAANVLTEITAACPDLPNRERMIRDGAYFYGIAGQWLRAERLASAYLKSDSKKFSADMQYLLARSTEYQLKISSSANDYFNLAKNYPEHPKSKVALERARTLAKAEELDDLSLAIAELMISRSNREENRFTHIDESINILLKQEKYDEAEKNGRLRLRLSSGTYEKFQSRYKLAEIAYLAGSKQESLDLLKILEKNIIDRKSKLKNLEYRDLIGKVNFLIGYHYKNLFYTINLNSSSDTQTAINRKSAYFLESSRYFEKVISSGDPQLEPKARYEIASTAEDFSNEISGIYIRSERLSKIIAQSRNKATIQRLQKLAQAQYARNVILSRQKPDIYAKNEWILKSLNRLNDDKNKTSSPEYNEISPIASYGGLISQWNTNSNF